MIHLRKCRTSETTKARFYTFLKFIFSSGIAFLFDLSLFYLFNNFILKDFSESIIASTVIARVSSSLLNFFVNNYFVFKNRLHIYSAVKYYLLWFCIMVASALLVKWLAGVLPFDTVVVKIGIDSVLFLCSYVVQRVWVFKL